MVRLKSICKTAFGTDSIRRVDRFCPGTLCARAKRACPSGEPFVAGGLAPDSSRWRWTASRGTAWSDPNTKTRRCSPA